MELSKWQTHNLKVKALEYRQFLLHPEEFRVFDIDKKNVKAFKDSGLKVTGKRKSVIPLKGFDDVQVDGEKLIYTGRNKRGKKITEKITLAQSGNFHARLKELSELKLKKNQFITVKIGDNATFNNRFQNYADLYHYVQNVFQPKDKGQTKEKLLRYMSIVEIEEKSHAKEKTKGTPTKTRRR